MSHRDARNGLLLLFGICFIFLIAGLTLGYMATQNLFWAVVIGLGTFAAAFGLFWLKLNNKL